MGPYDASMSSSGSNSSSSSAGEAPDQIDGLLAGAGYRVRSSELRYVAQRLERLENVMVNAPAEVSQLTNDVVSSPASASPPPAPAPPTSQRPRRRLARQRPRCGHHWSSLSYPTQLTSLLSGLILVLSLYEFKICGVCN
ncbi:hypothetical protein CsSME_00006200 [Camellia sinensis var. sinensis]